MTTMNNKIWGWAGPKPYHSCDKQNFIFGSSFDWSWFRVYFQITEVKYKLSSSAICFTPNFLFSPVDVFFCLLWVIFLTIRGLGLLHKTCFCLPKYTDTFTLHCCALFAFPDDLLVIDRHWLEIVKIIPTQLLLRLSWSLGWKR